MKKNIDQILILITTLILGMFFGMGILGPAVSVDLSNQSIVTIFKGSRVLLVIALVITVIQSILDIFRELEQEKKWLRIIVIVLIGLIRIFIIYEISNLFLYGVFHKPAFPSTLVALFLTD